MRRIPSLFLLLLCVTLGTAQERAALTLHMKNGDIMTGSSSIATIPITTEYGNLSIPVDQVKRITLGAHTSNLDKETVREQLDKMQYGSGEEAERAFDKLVARGESVLGLLKDYMQMPDYTPRPHSQISPEVLFKVILEQNNLPWNYSTKDRIQFNHDNVVEGKYTFESIWLDSDYGNFEAKRENIKIIEVRFREERPGVKTYKLLADYNITANQRDGWLKTGMLVKAGDLLTIESAGKIQLASLDGNTYGPNGGVNGSTGPAEEKPTFGNVVYKIGDGGPMIKASDFFRGKVETTGVLYLSIFESVYNTGNTGHYVSKVRVD